MIFSHLNHLNLIEGTYYHLIRKLLATRAIYHIRYIKYRGLFTIPRLLLIVFAKHVRRSRLVWTCHNIHEHNIPSKATNTVVRHILGMCANDIIVFHPDLVSHLPKHAQPKVHVANFGSFAAFFENKTKTNPAFHSQYRSWLNKNRISSPQIVLISAAKKQRTETLIEACGTFNISTLIISPGNPPPASDDLNRPHLLYFHESFVEQEVYDILNTDAPIVGFIGHDNVSVPTSIYMYASFGIPMIGINQSPVNTIIQEHGIGEIACSAEEIAQSYQHIQNNYEHYQRNCGQFIANQTWQKSAQAHRDAFVLTPSK